MTAKQKASGSLMAARQLGIKGLTKDTPEAEILQAIRDVLGEPDLDANDQASKDERTESYARVIAKHGEESIAKETGPVTATLNNIPNLTPTGIWEGKRARIHRVKTGHNDMAGAIFRWNGFPCIIPIDLTVDIAWPIYEVMLKTVGMEMEITQEDDPQDKSKVRNVKNITYYDKYPFQFKGVTPGTEDLPESPWEYTLDMYVDGFPDFSVRMWRQLCILWEITDAIANIEPGMGADREAAARTNAIHYALNLPQNVTREVRAQVRNEKRNDIGMPAKAA